jgi:uncharacterized protein
LFALANEPIEKLFALANEPIENFHNIATQLTMTDSPLPTSTNEASPTPFARALSAPELRVLGTLIEKSLTTPEQYPLSLNSAKVGCNQKTSREPVVNYDDRTTGIALKDLSELKLVRDIYPNDRGAVKYEHRLGNVLDLRAPAVAVLALLFLRGAQTTGELRQNGNRLHAFETLGHLEDVLDRLEARGLVFKLDRAPGQREERYIHLLGDREQALKQAAASSGRDSGGSASVQASADILLELRAQIAELKARVEALEQLMQ